MKSSRQEKTINHQLVKIFTMIKYFFLCFTCFFLLYCTKNDQPKHTREIPKLDIIQAGRLAELPLKCIDKEYPNKLNQTLVGDEDLQSPQTLHPAFYGCFDWHSAVHGHWSLVSLLKQFPELPKADTIKMKLLQHISEKNIKAEIVYFQKEHEKTFERTYGWAWLLKLAEELHTWKDPLGKKLERNLKPLTHIIVDKYLEFLPKLKYPIRVGTHTNTAFGLSFAYDYAKTVGNDSLKRMIEQRAIDFYGNDKGCPRNWEPGGYDFLSPCLEEIDIMRKVLKKDDFLTWLTYFSPELANKKFTWQPGIVGDRSDGHLVHLDGVNFSRAWCLYGLANEFREYEHLSYIADAHINYSLPNLVGDQYEGGHWLASFAIFALNAQ